MGTQIVLTLQMESHPATIPPQRKNHIKTGEQNPNLTDKTNQPTRLTKKKIVHI